MEAAWITSLREECSRIGQRRVAEKLRYSAAVVSQVLGGTYKGDLQAVEQAVNGALMGATVECPVLETIVSQKCLEMQRRPFAATNPTRIALWRACRSGCPHSRLPKEE